MSVMWCVDCDQFIDTDFDAEHFDKCREEYERSMAEMKIAVQNDASVGVQYVPSFWWTNNQNKDLQASEWKDAKEVAKDPELRPDLDYLAEIEMNNYENLNDTEERERSYE